MGGLLSLHSPRRTRCESGTPIVVRKGLVVNPSFREKHPGLRGPGCLDDTRDNVAWFMEGGDTDTSELRHLRNAGPALSRKEHRIASTRPPVCQPLVPDCFRNSSCSPCFSL